MDGSANFLFRQRHDHSLDLTPVTEADDIALFAAVFGTRSCLEPGVVAIGFDQQRCIGKRLTAEGRVVTAGRNVFFCRTEVFDAAGTLVAFGASTHRYRAGSGDPRGVPAEG